MPATFVSEREFAQLDHEARLPDRERGYQERMGAMLRLREMAAQQREGEAKEQSGPHQLPAHARLEPVPRADRGGGGPRARDDRGDPCDGLRGVGGPLQRRGGGCAERWPAVGRRAADGRQTWEGGGRGGLGGEQPEQ